MSTVRVRCMTPSCAWVGRSRQVPVSLIGLGAGVFGLLRLFCECGHELETHLELTAGTPA